MEREAAVALANRVLDDHRRDPDDDTSVLARQLLRAGERDAFEAGEATAWLLANTPEDWCWGFGYHPYHSSCRGRGPGQRRITLLLHLPADPVGPNKPERPPQLFEEMTVGDKGASYLTLARLVVERAQNLIAGRGQAIPPSEWRQAKAAESAATELLRAARKATGWAPVYAKDLQAAAMLERLGLATVEDDTEGMSLRLTDTGKGGA